MSTYGRKRNSLRESDSGLSNQDSRDRLREKRNRPRDPYSIRESRTARPVERRQGASASAHTPELRLRAPKRQYLAVSRTAIDKSKVAERERAAARPGSTTNSREISGRKMRSRKTTSQRAISTSPKGGAGAGAGNAAASGTRKGEKRSALATQPSRRTREQREADRKAAQRQKELRLRNFKIAGIGMLTLFVASLLFWGGSTIASSRFFEPEIITVQGAQLISVEDIERIAQVDPASSTITMDTSAIEERLLENPWIAQAEVSTSFPREVVIEVRERIPAVQVAVDGIVHIASSDGKWLGYLSGDEDELQIIDPTGSVGRVDLPDIRIIPVEGIIGLSPSWGEEVEDDSLLNVLAHLRGLNPQIVSSVERVLAPEVGRTSLFTVDGVELDVGVADNLPEKSTIILDILETLEDNVVLINVRSIENPNWRGLAP